MRLTKTEAGKKAITDRSIPLSPRQRSALIIFNGELTLDEVLLMLVGLGFTQDDADQLIALGLISPVLDAVKTNVVSEAKPKEQLGGFVDVETAQSRYKAAYPLATKLTASMGFRGFRLNLAVEAAGSYSQLVELFPKIKEAAGAEKSLALENALRGGV